MHRPGHITKHGESYVALIGVARLEYYHQLERERMHLLLLDDARRGLADIESSRTEAAAAAIANIQQRRVNSKIGKVVKTRD